MGTGLESIGENRGEAASGGCPVAAAGGPRTWRRGSLFLSAVAAALALAVGVGVGVCVDRSPDTRKASPGSAAKAEKAQKTEQKPDQEQQFMRLSRDSGRRPLALEAAIVTYAPRAGARTSPTVDLIAALHVADKAYYDQLNERFSKYDVVLYELVAPEGTRIPKGARPDNKHPITALQTFMTKVLNLQYQLECIDYTKPNLVHADMSPEQLAEAMQKRGESVMKILLRMMGYAMAREGFGDDADSARLLIALFDKNRSLALKRIMAEQFQDMEGSIAAIEGPKGSALISDRNGVALKVLRKQIAAGKKKIAIFYGAGHMPDFDRRLRGQFGLTPTDTRWLVAWDLKGEAKTPAPKK